MIGIIGAGISGLSAAYRLCQGYRLLEREHVVGGMCQSKDIDGYVFDDFPTVLPAYSPQVNTLIAELLEKNVSSKIRRAQVHLDGFNVRYPIEYNLGGAPHAIAEECAMGAIDAQMRTLSRGLAGLDAQSQEIGTETDLQTYISNAFGDGLCKMFFGPYERKFWKRDISTVSAAPLTHMFSKPMLAMIIRGCLGISSCGERYEGQASKKHDNIEHSDDGSFAYPIKGGIGAFSNAFVPALSSLELGSDVTGISHSKGRVNVRFVRGRIEREYEFDKILSSMPLVHAVEIMDAPSEIKHAAGRLEYLATVCVNLGINRKNVSDQHWIYFPEDRYIFNRLHFPMNFSRFNVPRGRSAIAAEITLPQGKLPDLEMVEQEVIDGMKDACILRRRDCIDVIETLVHQYAIPVPSKECIASAEKVVSYMRSIGIMHIGPSCEFPTIESAIMKGMHAAEETAAL